MGGRPYRYPGGSLADGWPNKKERFANVAYDVGVTLDDIPLKFQNSLGVINAFSAGVECGDRKMTGGRALALMVASRQYGKLQPAAFLAGYQLGESRRPMYTYWEKERRRVADMMSDDELGVAYENVRVRMYDTDLTPHE